MKKILAIFLIIFNMSLITAYASGEYVGKATFEDNILFINGNSVAATKLPDGLVYIPVENLEAYGFEVSYSDDKGYKEYIIRRDEAGLFVPEFAYNKDRYSEYTEVYTTDAKVYLDSDITAGVYELENGTVLLRSDALAKYGKYSQDTESHAVSVCFDNAEFMPEGQPFHNVLGLNDVDDIASGVIVRNDGKCADIEPNDLKQWLSVYWDFAPYDRVTGPYDDSVYRDSYIKLWTKDKTRSFIIYPNGGVVVGGFGEPSMSHGEVKKNYIWYLPYIGNGKNALYMADTELSMKYIIEQSDDFKDTLRDVTSDDAEILPDNNLLNTNGASDWAKPEIQKAAACNLLPYELTDKYAKNITRKEFCDLIYRLIATEFSPDSDSRLGESNAIYAVINERELSAAVELVSFSDYEHDKIKFLSGAGIIYGMGDGTFAPWEDVTREQAATILYRTAEFLRNKTIQKADHDKIYDDENVISDWAISSVKTMKAMNIMEGVSEREFAPKGNYTVEQAIATMVRLYECP